MNNFELAKFGQDLAQQHYQENGYNLVTSNFQYYQPGTQGRQAEIDLIFTKENRVFLIEVKTRSTLQYGMAIEQITPKKIKCVQKAYHYFLYKYPIYQNYFFQFDVAAVQNGKLNLVQNVQCF